MNTEEARPSARTSSVCFVNLSTFAHHRTPLRKADTESHPDGLIVAGLYHLGLQRDKALGLKWGYFDFEGDWIHIDRDIVFAGPTAKEGELKTEAADRHVLIPPWLKSALLITCSFIILICPVRYLLSSWYLLPFPVVQFRHQFLRSFDQFWLLSHQNQCCCLLLLLFSHDRFSFSS